MKSMLKKEASMLALIGIPIGVILSFTIIKVIIYLINILISKSLKDVFTLIPINENIQLCMKVPVVFLLVSILVIYIIILLLSILPMKKIKKQSNIESIKNISKKTSVPPIIKKLFDQEGILAFKNIKRDRVKYNSIIISITINIILYLSISGMISNLYKNENIESQYSDYTIILEDEEKVNTVIEYLETNNLINKYFVAAILDSSIIEIKDENLTYATKQMKEKNRNVDIPIITYSFSNDVYNEFLKRAGISELKKDEVIIGNTISKQTKYGKNIQLVNYRIGEEYILPIRGKESKELTLKVAGIVYNLYPYLEEINLENPYIIQIVNEETAKEILEVKGMYNKSLAIYIDTDNANKIDNALIMQINYQSKMSKRQ